MPEKMFYIEGEWLTYEQAHRLGYSLLPQRLITFYTADNQQVVVRQDSSDDTFYDSENLTWVADFAELNLYKRVKNSSYYRGESSSNYKCYIASISETSPSYILYDSQIISLRDAYENYGITSYPCKNIIVDENNIAIVWYDSSTTKYFDDRDGCHAWVDNIDDIKVTMYDSLANLASSVYESESLDAFYINSRFISRDSFYEYDNYGIIRDTTFTLKDEIVYTTYYDSYSDEYCIPNVTSIWMSKDDILELGYIFVEGVADMWLCEMPLHLPWKYLPGSVTISFTNTSHSDLPITLPENIEASVGSEIVLPEITGVYTDAYSVRWVATRWNIGEFNSTFILNENVRADLDCEKVKVMLSFVNDYYQTLEIPLPDSRTVDNGDLVTLPLVTGEYEDDHMVIWEPRAWDIGHFGESIALSYDTVAHILCSRKSSRFAVCGEVSEDSSYSLIKETPDLLSNESLYLSNYPLIAAFSILDSENTVINGTLESNDEYWLTDANFCPFSVITTGNITSNDYTLTLDHVAFHIDSTMRLSTMNYHDYRSTEYVMPTFGIVQSDD